MRRAIFAADDFGLSEGVNDAVERAHRDGVLSTASLMVAAPAAADAVRRARRLPRLRVGLHLVVIEGASINPDAVPLLVDGAGNFPSDQLGLGIRYFFRPRARRQLAAEIRAQFAAFARTGLRLDHANAHKHMHMHPTVGGLLIGIGAEFGLPALRIPREPARPMQRSGTPVGPGGRALNAWSGLLRRQAVAAGLQVNDHVFGIAWSGHVTRDRLLRLTPNLPRGLSEIYFHPATRQDGLLARFMPGYEHQAELAALLDPALPQALAAAGVEQATYGTA